MLYQLSYFRISSFLKGVFFVELLSSVGHYREVTPSFFVRSPQIRSSINSGFFFSNETVVRFRLKLWEKMDSNHRRYKPADLQSAPFGHSGILPFSFLLSVFFVGLYIVGQSFTPVNSFPPRSSASNPIQNKLQKSFVKELLSRWRESNPRPRDYKSRALAN